MSLLELRAVSKRYVQGGNEVVALHGVDLVVEAGESLSLVGPSGSGKSTLLHLAGGLDRPDAGEVLLDGSPLSQLSAGERARLRRRQLGFVFQMFHLVPGLTVAENVELPLLLDGRKDRDGRVTTLLEALGIAHRAGHQPGELSGGEMQRTAIARALVSQPRLVLADEPTGNLDSATGSEILEVLYRAVASTGCALVIVTHDAAVAARADRTLHLRDGRFEASPPRRRKAAKAPAAPVA